MTDKVEGTPAQEPPKAEGQNNSTAEEPKEPKTLLDKADATTEAKPAETKPETKTPEQTVVPEKYDLKLPDGSLLDAKHLETVTSFAKEKKLSQEQAQMLLQQRHEGFAAARESFVKGQDEEVKALPTRLLEETKADPEIGGDKLTENVSLANKAFKAFASDELLKTLQKTGLGNHKELVRTFAKIGKAMADDKFIIAGNQNAAKKGDMASRLYDNTKETQ